MAATNTLHTALPLELFKNCDDGDEAGVVVYPGQFAFAAGPPTKSSTFSSDLR